MKRNLRSGIFIKTLLNIAVNEKAIHSGEKFDLQYANINSIDYDHNSIYSFLRKHEESLLLIVVNFRDNDRFVSLSIPEEAFIYLNIETERDYTGTDLITGKRSKFRLYPYCTTGIEVKKFGVRIIRLSL